MVRANRIEERGSSRLNLILTLIILGAMIFSGIKIFPAYFANYQLQDAMQTEARFAMSNRKDPNGIRDDVWTKMQELEIPAKKEEIRVVIVNGVVTISLDYGVPIDLKVYQFTLQFHPRADNHSI